MLLPSVFSVKALTNIDKQIPNTTTVTGVPQNQNLSSKTNVIGIAPYYAWELLTNTSNGIQIPIDLRTDEDWNVSFIDTPYPESPIHYPLTTMQTPEGLQEFIDLYNGKEVVLYDKAGGSRIFAAINILVDASFNGTIYYIIGGIVEWILEGFPVRQNAPPNAPVITGQTRVKVNKLYAFTFNATDLNNDGVKYFIDWGDGFSQWTNYNYSGKEVTISHSWSKQGTVYIKAKTMDFYGNESDWGTFEIKISKTRNKVIDYSLFMRFLEQSQDVFPILKCVIRGR